MEFFSIGQQANGFIAIGQEATGVIAIGQLATGVIAIGQGARGIFAVGMLSCGVVSIGMLSFGIVHSVGMIGVGGRGFGGVLPLCPKLPAQAKLPEPTSRDALETSGASGWIAAEPQRTPGGFGLVVDGRPFRAKLGSRMVRAAAQAVATGSRVLAYVSPSSSGPEVTRLMRLPRASVLDASFLGLSVLQLGGLAIVSAAYFWFGLAPVVDALIGLGKDG